MSRQVNMLYWWILGISLLAAGCGTSQSHFTYDSSFVPNIPKTGQGCYDAAVLLGTDIAKAREIALKVLALNDGQIKAATETYLQAWRPLRNFSSSGGEELTVQLEKVDDNQTFVTVTTLTMGWGRSEPWSCEVINEMVLRAEYD
jgi:hypothetical protein